MLESALVKLLGLIQVFHFVKSVRIHSSSSPYFPAFGLNTDQNNSEYRHFLSNVLSKKFPENVNFLISRNAFFFEYISTLF